MIQPVKKLLLIFLLMLLPLQFSWAAAAPYCQHEQEQTTQHLGHHSHLHEAKADADANGDAPDGVADYSATHDDCGYCHLSCQASFVMASFDIAAPDGWAYLELYPASFSSHISDGPKRPDWRFVA
jgi:hypothetical protein